MSSDSSAFTLERLQLLEKAITDGARRVKYSDKEVEYRSIEEMLKIRELMRRQLGLTGKCGEKGLFGGTRTTAKFSKGLTNGEGDESC